MLFVHSGNLLAPRGEPGRQIDATGRQFLCETRQRPVQVAEHRIIDAHIFIELRRVDVKMDDFRLRRELLDYARHTVVKTNADSEQQVAAHDGHIRGIGSVHACHAEVRLRVRIDAAKSHQRRADGNPRFFDDRTKVLRLVRQRYAAAHKGQRALRLQERFHRRVDSAFFSLKKPGIAFQMHFLRIVEIHLRAENVGGDVHYHRPRPPRPGDEERLFDGPKQILRTLDEIIMLRDWRRDAADVRFLERVLADDGSRHLSGETNERNRIHIGGGDARHEIRAARSRSREANADFSRSARVAVRRQRRALLMTHKDMREFHFIDFIVQRQDDAARITENDVHALLLQALQNRLRSIDTHFDFPLINKYLLYFSTKRSGKASIYLKGFLFCCVIVSFCNECYFCERSRCLLIRLCVIV